MRRCGDTIRIDRPTRRCIRFLRNRRAHSHRTRIARAPSIAVASRGRHEDDLPPIETERDLILVDALDVVALDLAADLREDMRRSVPVEQQRLTALGHDSNHTQRHLAARHPGWRANIGGPRVVGAHQGSEQSQRESSGDDAHDRLRLQSAIRQLSCRSSDGKHVRASSSCVDSFTGDFDTRKKAAPRREQNVPDRGPTRARRHLAPCRARKGGAARRRRPLVGRYLASFAGGLRPSSGAPGGGAQLRLRGVSSSTRRTSSRALHQPSHQLDRAGSRGHRTSRDHVTHRATRHAS